MSNDSEPTADPPVEPTIERGEIVDAPQAPGSGWRAPPAGRHGAHGG
ncbi:MAG: hypothetical protein WKF58_12505 [Ilumatobacteraceae bacterium]